MTVHAVRTPAWPDPAAPAAPRSRKGKAAKVENPFPYGYRWREVRQADGSKRYEQVALAPEDFLNPQVDDVMPQGNWHDLFLAPLVGLLRRRLKALGLYVFHDLIVRFNLRGVSNPAPDISVVRAEHVVDPKSIETWEAHDPERRPLFVAEALSRNTKSMDLKDKKKSYAKAGVREYFIFNILKDPVEILAYRLGESKRAYRTLEPDARGRFASEVLGLAFRVDETNPLGVVVEDPVTGEHLLTHEEKVEALEQELGSETVARKEAEKRARQEAKRADREAKRAAELEAQLEELLGKAAKKQAVKSSPKSRRGRK